MEQESNQAHRKAACKHSHYCVQSPHQFEEAMCSEDCFAQ